MYSRSGEPAWETVTSSPTPPPWSTSVSWEKADIFKPASYQPYLKDATTVVHTMGILLEADYKNVLQGKESIVGGLKKAWGAKQTPNPLERDVGEEVPTGNNQLTYEAINRDSGRSIRAPSMC
jgi:hypothetical protein